MLTRPMLTVHDAADILQVRESTVRALINDKRLRAVKIGKEWRIAQRDLLFFLNENANRDPEAAQEAADGEPDSNEGVAPASGSETDASQGALESDTSLATESSPAEFELTVPGDVESSHGEPEHNDAGNTASGQPETKD